MQHEAPRKRVVREYPGTGPEPWAGRWKTLADAEVPAAPVPEAPRTEVSTRGPWGPGRPWEGEDRGARGRDRTYLLSLHSLGCLTRSHLRRRKRFRRGDALGVEQLDHGVSSSLEGVISMDGSCRNSLPGASTPGRSRASPASRLCSCTFFVRRILKRRRRSVGVDALDQTALPWGAPCGPGTCRAGSCRLSIRLAAGMGPREPALGPPPPFARGALGPRVRQRARLERREAPGSSPGAPRGRDAGAPTLPGARPP